MNLAKSWDIRWICKTRCISMYISKQKVENEKKVHHFTVAIKNPIKYIRINYLPSSLHMLCSSPFLCTTTNALSISAFVHAASFPPMSSLRLSTRVNGPHPLCLRHYLLCRTRWRAFLPFPLWLVRPPLWTLSRLELCSINQSGKRVGRETRSLCFKSPSCYLISVDLGKLQSLSSLSS